MADPTEVAPGVDAPQERHPEGIPGTASASAGSYARLSVPGQPCHHRVVAETTKVNSPVSRPFTFYSLFYHNST